MTASFDAIGRFAAARWDKDLADIECVQLGQNAVYRLADRFLRLAPATHRTRAMIEAEIEFIGHLKSQGCEVAAAIRSSSGNFVETIDEMHAAVFEAVSGEKANWGDDRENRAILRERGTLLGRIHRDSKSFHPKGEPRFHWHQDELFHRPELFLPADDSQLRAEFDDMTAWLAKRPVTSENYGMIHGDFVSANVLRNGGKAVTFDFDDCCYHWFACDIAIAMWTARHLPTKFRKPYLDCFLEAYARENSLAGDTCREIGWFMRLVAIYRYTHGLRSGVASNDLEEIRRIIGSPIDWC